MAILLLKSRFIPHILSARLFSREIAGDLAVLLTAIVVTEGGAEGVGRCKLSALPFSHVLGVAAIRSAKSSKALMLLLSRTITLITDRADLSTGASPRERTSFSVSRVLMLGGARKMLTVWTLERANQARANTLGSFLIAGVMRSVENCSAKLCSNLSAGTRLLLIISSLLVASLIRVARPRAAVGLVLFAVHTSDSLVDVLLACEDLP